MKSPSPSPEWSLFITLRGLWILAVAIVVFLALLVVPSPDSLLYLVAILVSSLLVGLVYITRRRTSYRPTFRLSFKGSEGQELPFSAALQSTASLPIFYLTTTLEGDFLAAPVQVRTPVLRSRQTATLHYRVVLGARGVYRRCTLTWSFMDPIGVLRRFCKTTAPCTIVVTPRYVPISELPWEASGSLFQSIRPSLAHESGGSEFLGLRPLLSGESLRRVHWLTTARKQVPFVKQFAAEGESAYLIIVDLHKDSVFGYKPDSSHDTALRVAASIARFVLFHRNHLVGFLANSDPPAFLIPGSGETHFDSLLSLLAGMEPQSGPSISDALSSSLPFVSPQNIQLLIITTTVSDALTRVLLRLPPSLPPPVLIRIRPEPFARPADRNRILPSPLQVANLNMLLSRGILSCTITTEKDLQKWVPPVQRPA
jgi:uncharacterized protein (DUF58 family)